MVFEKCVSLWDFVEGKWSKSEQEFCTRREDSDRDECGLCFASKLPSAQGAYGADEEESFAAPVKAGFNFEKRDEVSPQLNAFHSWLVSDQTHFDIIFCGGRGNKSEPSHVGKQV